MHSIESTPVATSKQPLIKKIFFCWLALLSGFVGGHWIYQGNYKRALIHLVPVLGSLLGCFDCIRFGLMHDEQFNTTFNPLYPAHLKQTNGVVVVAVAFSLALGTSILMFTIAMVFQLILAGSIA